MNEQLNQPGANHASLPCLSQNPLRIRRPYKSKITALPPDVRNFVNQSIHDHVPYPEIIEQLEAKGHPGFKRNNFSRWVKTGYQEWLLHKERFEHIALKFDEAETFRKQFESEGVTASSRVNGLLQTAQILQAMRDFDPDAILKHLNAKPDSFFKLARLINDQAAAN